MKTSKRASALKKSGKKQTSTFNCKKTEQEAAPSALPAFENPARETHSDSGFVREQRRYPPPYFSSQRMPPKGGSNQRSARPRQDIVQWAAEVNDQGQQNCNNEQGQLQDSRVPPISDGAAEQGRTFLPDGRSVWHTNDGGYYIYSPTDFGGSASSLNRVNPPYQIAEIGAAKGKHKWDDLYYFGALAASRHATTHVFSGIVATIFGLIVMKTQAFQWMYSEGIIAGGLFFLCGFICCLCCSPKTSVFTCIFSSIIAIILIAHVAIVFYVEGYRVREIWEKRDNVLGLWSVLGCTMAGVIELLLGLSSCSACLTYADIVDRLAMRKQQMNLANQYPDRFGSLLSSWSSRSDLGLNGGRNTGIDEEDELDAAKDQMDDQGMEQGALDDFMENDLANMAERDAEVELVMAEYDAGDAGGDAGYDVND